MVFHAFFTIVFLIPAVLAVLYLLGYLVAGLCRARDERPPSKSPSTRFVVLIPAHNEGTAMISTLESVKAIDYPCELHQAIVIADNCTDTTANIAAEYGITCWERMDQTRKGKGQALDWAFQHVSWQQYDAVVVLDADCTLRPDALQILDAFVRSGSLAVQSNHHVTNTDISPISYVAAVGRTLEYELFFAPKSRLGFGVMLVGTGMMLHRDLLKKIPWTARSCAEDTEYTVNLAEQKQYVQFAANAYVDISSASTKHQLDVQRKRWAGGNLHAGRWNAIKLFVSGLKTRNIRNIDLAMSLIVASKPLLIVHAASTCILSLLWHVTAPDRWTRIWMLVSVAIVLAYVLYFSVGLFWLGLNRRRLGYLLRAPFVVARLVVIACSAILTNRPSGWNRTPRG